MQPRDYQGRPFLKMLSLTALVLRLASSYSIQISGIECCHRHERIQRLLIGPACLPACLPCFWLSCGAHTDKLLSLCWRHYQVQNKFFTVYYMLKHILWCTLQCHIFVIIIYIYQDMWGNNKEFCPRFLSEHEENTKGQW
jgi:hypothetical protein